MIKFTILGEPASKANSRKVAKFGNRPAMLIKSDKARAFEKSALYQIPVWARQRIEGPVCVSMWIYYATERPDLDESLLLDILQDRWSRDKKTGVKSRVQDGVYRNDRQVRERHVYHGIDRKNPRTEIIIEPLVMQQASLLGVAS